MFKPLKYLVSGYWNLVAAHVFFFSQGKNWWNNGYHMSQIEIKQWSSTIIGTGNTIAYFFNIANPVADIFKRFLICDVVHQHDSLQRNKLSKMEIFFCRREIFHFYSYNIVNLSFMIIIITVYSILINKNMCHLAANSSISLIHTAN